MSEPIGDDYVDVDAIYAAQLAELDAINAGIQEESDRLDAEDAEDQRVADQAEEEMRKLERMAEAAVRGYDFDDDGYVVDNVTPISAARSWNGGSSAGM